MSETKPTFSLISPEALIEVAGAYSQGIKKHEGSEADGIDYDNLTPRQYLDKIWRHLLALQDGEIISDDGIRHDVAIICDAMIYFDLVNREADEFKQMVESTGIPPDVAEEFAPDIAQCPDCKGHFSGDHACQKKSSCKGMTFMNSKPFLCDFNDGDQKCSLSFSTYPELVAHQRKDHYDLIGSEAAKANCCGQR